MNADKDIPTNTWTVTNRAGQEIGRVEGETFDDAACAMRQNADLVKVSNREGGVALRRLRTSEL